MKKEQAAACAYVCLYGSYLEILAPFSDAEKGRLMTAMLEYMQQDKEPDFQGNERFIWPSIKGQIDRDREAYAQRCRKNRENGAKGGRPPKNQSEKTDGFSEEPQKPKEKENEKEKEKENENENERENRSLLPGAALTPPPFQIPTSFEIMEFCKQEDCEVDPWRFLDYYNAIGWHLGNTPIRDWRPLVRKWNDVP